MVRLHNQPRLKSLRQRLRNEGTAAEACLWQLLMGRQLLGRKFRRQHSVGSYILDFYCPEERLAIELDGASHDDPLRSKYDHKRTEYLTRQGIRVVRIDNQVLFDRPVDAVCYLAGFLGARVTEDDSA